MKILMLTPYLPYPPHSGGQTRSFNLIKQLGLKHKITLFCFIREEEEKRYKKNLAPYCEKVKLFKRRKAWALLNILLAGLSYYPFLVSIYRSREVQKAIAKALREDDYDLIHVETFYLMPNVPQTDIPILLVDQTIEYQVYQHFVESLSKALFFIKPFLWIDVIKLKFWETHYWKKAKMMVAVSQEDKKLMRSLIRNLPVKVIPNGVDETYFGQKVCSRAKNPTILFGIANFKWMQNKEGAKILVSRVWPLIKKQIPEAKLWIIGRHAPETLSWLKSEDILIQETKEPRKTYQQAWVLVAPMRSGGGSRTKFFEAMASELPIVTTPQGLEGIEAKEGEEIFASNDLQELAKKTIRLLEDKDLAQKVGGQAKELVKKKYNWDKSARKLDKVYQEIGSVKKT